MRFALGCTNGRRLGFVYAYICVVSDVKALFCELVMLSAINKESTATQSARLIKLV